MEGRENKVGKAIIYARVSTEKQAERELSLEAQEEICKKKAEELGYEVVKVFKEAESGRSAEKREEFLKAIDFAIQNKIDAFIVYDTSRFARNRQDAIVYKTLLRKNGVKLIYASQSIPEEDDLTSLFVEGILEIVDEYYSRKLSKDVLKSMIENAKRGFWNGGIPPFGYRKKVVQEFKGGRRKVKLEVNPEEASIVREIYELYLFCGAGAYQIANMLNEKGKLNRGKKWNKQSILRILENPIYIGKYVFGNVEVEDFCEPIIPREWYERVQREKIERRVSPEKGHYSSNQLLTGLIRCGKCGKTMHSEPAKSQRYRYYVCSTYKKGMGCESVRVRADIVERAVLETIKNHLDTEVLLKLRAELLKLLEKEREPLIEKLKLLKLEKSEIEKSIENLYRVLERTDEDNIDLILRRIKEREKQLRRTEEEISLLEQTTKLNLEEFLSYSIKELEEDLEKALREGDVKLKRRFLSSVLSGVYVIEKDSQDENYKTLEIQIVPKVPIEGISGEPGGTRTRDPRLKRPLLYLLSYRLCVAQLVERRGLEPPTSDMPYRRSPS